MTLRNQVTSLDYSGSIFKMETVVLLPLMVIMKIKTSGCGKILGGFKHVNDINNTSFPRILRRFIYKAQEMEGFILRDDYLVFYFCLIIRDFYAFT